MRETVGDRSEIPFWTEQFQSEKNRWPEDFKELRNFVIKKSHGRLMLKYYDDVSFEELSDGRLNVRCFHGGRLAIEYILLPEAQRKRARETNGLGT